MFKKSAKLLAVVLAGTMMLAGCGGSSDSGADSSDKSGIDSGAA